MFKKLSFALITTLLPGLSVAQDIEGTVTYKETIKIEIELPPEMEHIRDQIPPERTSEKILEFGEVNSLYKDAPRSEDAGLISSSRGGMTMRMSFEPPDHQIFRNWENDELIEKQDFMGRTFLISGEPASYPWKLTGEQAKALGYVVYRAEYADSSGVVEAWFTPELPVPTGPGMYGGLPGLILMMNINDGKRTIIASDISVEPLDHEIQAPDSGKKMTREEFDEMMKEKMKEMEAEMGRRGGGGGIFIRRH